MSRLLRLLKSLGVIAGTGVNVFCICHCIVEYGAEITFLTGPSMTPTFNQTSNNNVVITERLTTRWKWLAVGDVVITRSPSDPKQLVCKRVAALEGQRIRRTEGKYLESPEKYIEVPRGHVWLLGDNPENSTDSRMYGPVPLGLIRGRVCFKIWPLSECGSVS